MPLRIPLGAVLVVTSPIAELERRHETATLFDRAEKVMVCAAIVVVLRIAHWL